MTVDPRLLTQLSAWLAGTDIAVLELSGPGGALRLVRAGSDVVVVRHPSDTPAAIHTIRADGVGIFLDRHPLRLDPLAGPGSRHAAGDALGFLRVGPVLRAVAAPCDCHVEAVLAEPGTTVGFGAPLFAVVPLTVQEVP
jgi:biotin carboxyl carrier protein